MNTEKPKAPKRNNSELATMHPKGAQVKLAKALPYILELGHTSTGHAMNGMITELANIMSRFEDPSTAQNSLVEQPDV